MKSVEHLERQAREQRAQLQSSIIALQKRLTFPGLVTEAVELIIPGQFHLLPAIAAAKRHPLLSVALVTAASWIFKRGLRGPSTARGWLAKPDGGRQTNTSRKRHT
jgi:hypothetical protein